ncbi:MAG: PilZ domain-containing protein [Elusimicrobia bacterium]|nr:PilZ domain-containing protein [Elusimicrobiota bacterium]MDA8244312.1 PilZ domain-containing protein [Elusimicrobiota bacterium]
MGREQRRAERDRHDSVVELLGEDGRLEATGRLSDVSASGIAFSSDREFRKGEKVRARLRLLGRGVLDARGEVVWVRQAGGRSVYGVRFDAVTEVHPTGEKKERWD